MRTMSRVAPLVLTIVLITACGDSTAANPDLGGNWSGSAEGLTVSLSIASPTCTGGSCVGHGGGEWTYTSAQATASGKGGATYSSLRFPNHVDSVAVSLGDATSGLCFEFAGALVNTNTLSGTMTQKCTTQLALANYEAAFTLVRQ